MILLFIKKILLEMNSFIKIYRIEMNKTTNRVSTNHLNMYYEITL